MQYMNNQELKELFTKEDLHITKAVAILLKQAALYTKRIHVLQDSQQLADCENERAKYIYKAIEVATIEKQQHCRLIEDKERYLDAMNDKYGDVDFINDLKDLKKLVLIYRLENLDEQQQAHHSPEYMA